MNADQKASTKTPRESPGVIRRLFIGALGAGLTLVGLSQCYGAAQREIPVGMGLLGIVVSAAGIWLLRRSLSRQDPR